jgi:hypothetical protein
MLEIGAVIVLESILRCLPYGLVATGNGVLWAASLGCWPLWYGFGGAKPPGWQVAVAGIIGLATWMIAAVVLLVRLAGSAAIL